MFALLLLTLPFAQVSVPAESPPGPIPYTAGSLARMESGHQYYVESGGRPAAVLRATSRSAAAPSSRSPWV